MDFERYFGEVNNWTPENEEQRNDQFDRIRAMMEIKELYRKEKMSDEEYERNINLIVDDEQRQQFIDDHISQSSYDEEMDRLTELVSRIDAKYGFNQDKVGQEFTSEIIRKREELLAVQAYYRNLNNGQPSNIMFNADFNSMSANEIIDYYERMHAGLEKNANGHSFEELVELGREAIKEENRQRIRNRLAANNNPRRGNTGGNSGSTSSNGGTTGTPSGEGIQDKINKFANEAEKMKSEIDRVKVELVLGDENKGFELTEAVRGLETELGELANEADALKAEIDAFVLETGAADFSMTPAQIEKRVNELKKGVKNLKQTLVSKYDARVEMTNARIAELKAMTDLEPDVEFLINGLEELQKCEVTVQSWKHNKFLDIIDFNHLFEVNRAIADIENRLGVSKTPAGGVNPDGGDNGGNGTVEDDSLEADISYIESEIERIEMEIVPDLSVDDINRLKQDLQVVSDNVNNFRLKLESNKDKLTDDEYNNYIVRIEDAEAELASLYVQLKSKDNTKDDKNQDYEELLEAANKLSVDVDRLVDDVNAFYGFVVEGGVNVFESRLSVTEKELETLKNDIETRHKDGKIDVNQYNSLMDKVKDMEQKLTSTKDKLKDPGMIKDADIFALLNGEIDGLENAVNQLDQTVEKLNKPIKKEDRKNIDAVVNHLEKEVNRLGKLLEQYKDKDPDKYNATKERLNNVKNKLDEINKKYRKKCPLLVRAVKGAKDFFKKHKKVCLIIAGLAAMALVSYHVLIPAIMHGNIMIAGTSPAFRPFIKFTNNILGGLIHATKDAKGLWWLANGVMINPSCAASSLLKGLAISGVNSTLLVAPIVVAIKKLVEKMKTSELKQKLTESINKGKEKLPVKKEKTEKKPSTKKADKMTFDELAKLMKEYRGSGKSMDEFCAEKGFSDEDKMMFMWLDARSMKNVEEMKNSGKKGR